MQSYKVFINEHPVSFDEKPKFNEQSTSLLNIKADLGVNFQELVRWLLNESVDIEVNLFSDNVEKLWENFADSFNKLTAAGGLVRNEAGEILFIKRLGKWDLPKGKVENGESIEEAANREVKEECGLTELELGEKLPTTFHMYQMEEKNILKETHWFEMKSVSEQDLVPQTEEDIELVKWVDPKQIEEQLKNTYSSLKQILNRI
jgi:ADP-ribose pyrophosphatase YjhB (NUDIX family)